MPNPKMSMDSILTRFLKRASDPYYDEVRQFAQAKSSIKEMFLGEIPKESIATYKSYWGSKKLSKYGQGRNDTITDITKAIEKLFE